MAFESDCLHATTTMAGAVQPVRHQPDPADRGRLGAGHGSPRARRPEVGQAVPHPVVVPKAGAAKSVKGLCRPLVARLPLRAGGSSKTRVVPLPQFGASVPATAFHVPGPKPPVTG